MLTKHDIIAMIDPIIYAIESEDAHKGGVRYLHPEALVYHYYVSDLPGEISDLIWASHAPYSADIATLRLIFDIYRDLPCYDLLQEVVWRYPHLSEPIRTVFWDEVLALLTQPDDALAGPLCYMLWGDFLELDPNWQEVWTRLATPEAGTALLRRLLVCSFSIPFHAREPLYLALLGDPVYHQAIYNNLYDSYYTIYGHIDKVRAADILSQLSIPKDREFTKLQTALTQGDRYANHRGRRFPPV
jgi:hypothetical protein